MNFKGYLTFIWLRSEDLNLCGKRYAFHQSTVINWRDGGYQPTIHSGQVCDSLVKSSLIYQGP